MIRLETLSSYIHTYSRYITYTFETDLPVLLITRCARSITEVRASVSGLAPNLWEVMKKSQLRKKDSLSEMILWGRSSENMCLISCGIHLALSCEKCCKFIYNKGINKFIIDLVLPSVNRFDRPTISVEFLRWSFTSTHRQLSTTCLTTFLETSAYRPSLANIFHTERTNSLYSFEVIASRLGNLLSCDSREPFNCYWEPPCVQYRILCSDVCVSVPQLTPVFWGWVRSPQMSTICMQ